MIHIYAFSARAPLDHLLDGVADYNRDTKIFTFGLPEGFSLDLLETRMRVHLVAGLQ